MSDATTDAVKERVDIVALISESLPLKRAGSHFKARCPFHEEDTPSFVVSPARQMFHCFGCQTSGDVFTWLMKREGMSFPESLRVLAQRAGVPVTFERAERREERERLREALDLAVTFYHRILLETPEGRAARAYLEGRGLVAESVQSWRLGFCPEEPTPMLEKAAARGVSEDDLVRAGVLFRGAGGSFECFHGRIIFPLADAHGSVVALAGRVFEGDAGRPKYINSRETALYVKHRVLYGLDRAKEAIRRENLAIVVEGYTDVLACQQTGSANVVATSGTALTDEHLRLLRRFADRLAFAFDADAAGSAATRRAVELALASGFVVSVIVLPSGDDPADVAVRDSARWQRAVAERVDMFAYLLRRALAQYSVETPEGKKALAADLLPIVGVVTDRVVAGEYVQQLATALRVEPRYIADDLRRWQNRRGDKARAPEPAALSAPVGAEGSTRREERLLTLCVADYSLLPKVTRLLPDTSFEAPRTRDVYNALRTWYDRLRVSPELPAADSWQDFRAALPADLQAFLDTMLLAVDVERERGEWDPAREALGLVREILLVRLREDLRAHAELLRTAAGDDRPSLLREVAALVEGIARTERLQWL